jgi:ribosomal-protein-alanine N-acetyltransferase
MSAILRDPGARLRPMTDADVDAVMAIERAAYEFPWTVGILRDCLRVGYSCWVMENGQDIQAYAVMSVGGGEAHILNLCVHPQQQRRGLGRKLLGHLIALARRHAADTLLLEVRPTNRAALALYKQAGFNEVGVRKAYYPARDGREDALILALSLYDRVDCSIFRSFHAPPNP